MKIKTKVKADRGTRVRGHALCREGGAFDENGTFLGARLFYTTIGGPGRAMCECGALSEVLSTTRQRQQWHREHKAAVDQQG